VVHAYNSSTLEAEADSEASLGHLAKHCLGEKRSPGIVEHTYNPRYVGGVARRIEFQGLPWAKSARSHLKNT
jgi:hypothetical protein